MNKIYTLLVISCFYSVRSFSQLLGPVPIDDCLSLDCDDPQIVIALSGSSTANQGSTYQYNLSILGGGFHSSTTYSVSSGGQIISQSKTYVKIKWNTTGSKWVSGSAVVSGNHYLFSKSVTVNSSAPSMPSSPTISSNTCGNKIVTRANPPSGVTWYWQTSSGGTSTSNSNKTYTITSSRSIYLRARKNSNGQWSSARSKYVSVNQNPSRPSTPSISTNTCGNKTLTRGNPPSGVAWYWQTSSSGTSTSNSNKTYNVSSSRTVYLRARSLAGCWSSTRSVSVSVNSNPSQPSGTIEAQCGGTLFTRNNPPSGVTWYWQGTNSSGTSRSNSSQTYYLSASASGGSNVYLRGRNNSTGCWGASKAFNRSSISLPSLPPDPAISYSCNTATATQITLLLEEGSQISQTIQYYWQTSAAGTSTSNSSNTYTTSTNGTTVYLRGKNQFNGCWGEARTVTFNGILPSPSAPPMPIISGYACEQTHVIFAGSPPSGVNWYWQTSPSGTSTTSSYAELIVTSSGVRYLRSRNSQGCWGGTSAPSGVTVYTIPEEPSFTMEAECGVTKYTRSTPPSYETWYWQGTNRYGTSTSNSDAVYYGEQGGVSHFLRARNNFTNCWGPAKGIYAAQYGVPGIPDLPTVSLECGGAELNITYENKPSNVEWYWQGKNANGTSLGNKTSSFNAYTEGTYYIRSRMKYGPPYCWGESRAVVVSGFKSIPAMPDVPTSTDYCGYTLLHRGTPPQDVLWLWQTSSNGYSLANNTDDYTVTSHSNYYLRSYNTSTQCWGPTRTIFSFIGTPNPTTPVVYISDEQCDVVTLGISNPRPAPVNSYWQGTNASGTSTSNNNASYQVTESGTYYVRNKNVDTGCWSTVASINVTVNSCVIHDFDFAPQYNGNISAIKWKGHNDQSENIYTYHYDPMNRIKAAHYSSRNSGVDDWQSSEKKSMFNIYGINYDLNGNIQTLQRQGKNESIDRIDDLGYSYYGNKLLAVSDSKSEIGFKDGTNTGNDYTYDQNGNMIKDLNKDIISITYNHLNLPDRVTKSDGQYIQYTYDASGIKLAQEVYDASNVLQKRTDYIGEFIYETDDQGNRTLALIQHEEGRIVPDEIEGDYDYEYYLKDHLGNTRVVFTTDPKTHEFALNYESSSAAPDDEAFFDNLQSVIAADIHDRVDAGNESFNHDKVQLLNGGLNGVLGSVLTIPVGQGDKISAEVYAKYLAPTGTNNPTAAIGSLLTAALTGGTSLTGYESSINSSFGTTGNITGLVNSNASSTEPMAFINLMFLPENVGSSVADSHFAFKQITSASSNNHAILALDEPYEAPESGYVVVYLSNESAQLTEVYFDDLKITVNEHPVIETNSYYPFGGQHSGGYQRVTAKENRFKFNQGTLEKNHMGEEGKFFRTERITDLGLNLDMTKLRMYDYALGRFTSIDPLADAAGQEMYTPYHYGFNNPLRYYDPYGDCADPNDPDCQAAQKAGQGQSRLEQRQRQMFRNIQDRVDNTTVGGEIKISEVSVGVQGSVKTPVGSVDLNIASTKLLEAGIKAGNGQGVKGSADWIGKDGKQTITQGAQIELTGVGSIGGSREIERDIGGVGGQVTKEGGSVGIASTSVVKSKKNPNVDSLTRQSLKMEMGTKLILGWEVSIELNSQYMHEEVRENK